MFHEKIIIDIPVAFQKTFNYNSDPGKQLKNEWIMICFSNVKLVLWMTVLLITFFSVSKHTYLCPLRRLHLLGIL